MFNVALLHALSSQSTKQDKKCRFHSSSNQIIDIQLVAVELWMDKPKLN